MTTTRNNRNLHFSFTVSNGDTFTETCRDSLGGFGNMISRVRARYNDRVILTEATGNLYAAGTIGGHTFTVLQVNK